MARPTPGRRRRPISTSSRAAALAANLPDEVRETVLKLLVPLRRGLGLEHEQRCRLRLRLWHGLLAALHHRSMDQLGVAQYITRVGLLLGGIDVLDETKSRGWKTLTPGRGCAASWKTAWC